MLELIVIVWLLSPLGLIPLSAAALKKNRQLEDFISELFKQGRIDSFEYTNHRVFVPREKNDTGKAAPSDKPVFSDSTAVSSLHGGEMARESISRANGAAAPAKSAAVPARSAAVRSGSYTYPKEEPARKAAPSDKPVFSDSAAGSTLHGGEMARESISRANSTAQPPVYDFYAGSKSAEKSRVTNTAPLPAAAAREKKNAKAGAMSVLMMIGIIFVILAGLVFSTAVWVNLGSAGRTLAVAAVSAMFFGISAFAGKKLELMRTSFAFYTLGSFFLSIALITAGFFRLMGEYFSVSGGGRYLLYAGALVILSLLQAKGREIFGNAAAAYISAFSGTAAAVLLLVHIAPDIGVFALLAAILTAVINLALFIRDIDLPENWEKPLCSAAVLLSVVSLLGGMAAAFSDCDAFYGAAAVFIIRSAAAVYLGLKEHGVYGKTYSAWGALGTFSFFALCVMYKLSDSFEVFALLTAVTGIVFATTFFGFGIKIPGEWLPSVKTFSFILNGGGALLGFSALADSFGEWNGVCFCTAVLYILSSFGAGVWAFFGHRIFGKAPSAFGAVFTGTVFSLMLLYELFGKTAFFALCLSVILIIFINAVFTLRLPMPRDWEIPLGAAAVVLGAVSSVCAAFTLADNSGSWDMTCFVTAGLYILQSAAVAVMAARGHGEYSKARWAVISRPIGIIFTAAVLWELSGGSLFTLLLTVYALWSLNIAFTAKIPFTENWKKALGVFSSLTALWSISLTLFEMADNSGSWDMTCFVTAGLYILQSAAVAVMAARGHGEYSKARWAVISRPIGIIFTAAVLWELSGGGTLFTLLLTVYALWSLNIAFTAKIPFTENWKKALGVFSSLTALWSISLTLFEMAGSIGNWDMTCFATAGLYILQSAAVAVMAARGHGEYSKARWAAAAQVIGIGFSLIILFEIIPTAGELMLTLALVGILFSKVSDMILCRFPEEWIYAANIADKLLNIGAAVFSGCILLKFGGSWDIYCFAGAALYIAAAAVRGIRKNNPFFKGAECVLSCLTVYNIFCLTDNIIKSYSAAVFCLVCMLFGAALIHHFVKPLRTVFSDIFTAAVLGAAAANGAVWLNLPYEKNLFCTAGFVLWGIVLLLKALEKDRKGACVFGALLPLPVMGAVTSFIYACFEPAGAAGVSAAANGAVLAVIAAAIILVRKKTDIVFCSFSLMATFMIFAGAGEAAAAAVLAVLILTAVLLMALWEKSSYNVLSLLTMAGLALTVRETACYAEALTGRGDVFIIFAAGFALCSLVASKAFYGDSFVKREEGLFKIDSFCTGLLMSLPMVQSDNEKTAVFTVLTIMAVFAANLSRKGHRNGFNSVMLTIGSGLFAIALIGRPFLILTDELLAGKVTLGIICGFGFAFSRIWKKYPRLAENVSAGIYSVCFVCLIIDALSHQNLPNTLIVLGTSAAILIYSFYRKKKRWFAVSSVSLTGLTVYIFRDFFLMIDWWVYLLIVGLILIAVSSANEYFVKKGRELKEKAGRFFEDWSW